MMEVMALVQLDKDSYTPLYMQFYKILKDIIARSPAGTNLPPERALCEQYGLDRVTVRKALAMLADEKLIERKQGRGTRILSTPQEPGEKKCILFALYHGLHLVDRIGEPFYARSMEELERMLHARGERLAYCKVRQNDNLQDICDHLSVKGIIIAGMPDEQLIAQCRKLTIPIVAYNSRIDRLPCILADNESGAAAAASYLLSLGHREIGYFYVPEYANSEKRLKQFSRTLQESHLSDVCLRLVEGDWTEIGGYFAMKKLLAEHPSVTAIFAGNDSMALGALRALSEAGISVPERISVIGFDGIPQSMAAVPPLTTFQVDVHAMVEAACMMLFHLLSGGSCEGMQTTVSAKFLLRNSTGPVPKEAGTTI